jgi:hypothetical protein
MSNADLIAEYRDWAAEWQSGKEAEWGEKLATALEEVSRGYDYFERKFHDEKDRAEKAEARYEAADKYGIRMEKECEELLARLDIEKAATQVACSQATSFEKRLALYEAKPGGLVELAKEIASEDKLRDLSRWSDLLHIKDLIEALKAKLKETEVDDVEKNVD